MLRRLQRMNILGAGLEVKGSKAQGNMMHVEGQAWARSGGLRGGGNDNGYQ